MNLMINLSVEKAGRWDMFRVIFFWKCTIKGLIIHVMINQGLQFLCNCVVIILYLDFIIQSLSLTYLRTIFYICLNWPVRNICSAFVHLHLDWIDIWWKVKQTLIFYSDLIQCSLCWTSVNAVKVSFTFFENFW